MPKTSCRGSDGVAKTVLQERIFERGQVIEVPKISRRDSVEMVKNIHWERSSERMCEQSESPDQLWQRTVERNLDAWVEHDLAARAIVLERLREWCLKV